MGTVARIIFEAASNVLSFRLEETRDVPHCVWKASNLDVLSDPFRQLGGNTRCGITLVDQQQRSIVVLVSNRSTSMSEQSM